MDQHDGNYVKTSTIMKGRKVLYFKLLEKRNHVNLFLEKTVFSSEMNVFKNVLEI